MGREIRRVPPNWKHPQEEKHDHIRGRTGMQYKPLHDQSCEERWAEWLQEFARWTDGEHDKTIAKHGGEDYPKDQPYTAFCNWDGAPPNPEYYRPQWTEEEVTWWQVYETVSEGTPVTPPFETQDELIEYLVANGDFWDQSRREDGRTTMDCGPWARDQAEKFVRETGWAPSFVVDSKGVRSGVEAITDL